MTAAAAIESPPGATEEAFDAGLYRDLMAFAGREKFRGTLIDNCAAAPMGKGHGNNGQPFDIDTAWYLKPIVEAYHREGTRKLVLKAAVKTLKSFFLEMAAAHHVCHEIGDVGIFFGSAEQADDVSTTRILGYFEGIPSYRAKMETITGQWDATMSAVKFPDKTLFIKPANLANAQQKNLCFMGVEDAFVCGANGMIDQLIDRTTQYAWDKKIVLESQGGEKGFDFDRHYDKTDQGELHVICPHCGVSHVFNWKAFDEVEMRRPDDFKAQLPLSRVKEILDKHHASDEWREMSDREKEKSAKAIGEAVGISESAVLGLFES